jgi:hypothetical protein
MRIERPLAASWRKLSPLVSRVPITQATWRLIVNARGVSCRLFGGRRAAHGLRSSRAYVPKRRCYAQFHSDYDASCTPLPSPFKEDQPASRNSSIPVRGSDRPRAPRWRWLRRSPSPAATTASMDGEGLGIVHCGSHRAGWRGASILRDINGCSKARRGEVSDRCVALLSTRRLGGQSPNCRMTTPVAPLSPRGSTHSRRSFGRRAGSQGDPESNEPDNRSSLREPVQPGEPAHPSNVARIRDPIFIYVPPLIPWLPTSGHPRMSAPHRIDKRGTRVCLARFDANPASAYMCRAKGSAR